MPEFVLDHGGAAGTAAYMLLDDFTRGYVEAAFFTECHTDNPDLADATIADIPGDELARVMTDCAEFQGDYHYHIADALEHAERAGIDYDSTAAGRDYWYTRNGHGVGFWSRDLGAFGEKLTRCAKLRGGSSLYLGDDRRIHFT